MSATLNARMRHLHHSVASCIAGLTWITSLCPAAPVTCPAPVSFTARTQPVPTTPKTSRTTRTPVSSMCRLFSIWLLLSFSPKGNRSDSPATRTVRPSLDSLPSVFSVYPLLASSLNGNLFSEGPFLLSCIALYTFLFAIMLHPVPAIDNFLEASLGTLFELVRAHAHTHVCLVLPSFPTLSLCSDCVCPLRLACDAGLHHRGEHGCVFHAGGMISNRPIRHVTYLFSGQKSFSPINKLQDHHGRTVWHLRSADSRFPTKKRKSLIDCDR